MLASGSSAPSNKRVTSFSDGFRSTGSPPPTLPWISHWTACTFRDTDTAPLVWPPVVYLATDAPRFKVLSAGEPPQLHAASRRVELFAQDAPPRGVSKPHCLTAFFMAGLKTVIDRHVFRVRPQVFVRGAETISRSFAGYERDLLTNALERAGAKRIRWPDEAARG